MVDVENRDVGGKLTGKVRAGISRAGLGRRALLFAASCLAAAPLVQAAWVILQARVLGIMVGGSWSNPVSYLFTEGRVTVVPIAIAICVAACWRFGKKPAVAGTALSLASCYLSRPSNDYLFAGIYFITAILLIGYLVHKDENHEN